jgi:hypothetical protein
MFPNWKILATVIVVLLYVNCIQSTAVYVWDLLHSKDSAEICFNGNLAPLIKNRCDIRIISNQFVKINEDSKSNAVIASFLKDCAVPERICSANLSEASFVLSPKIPYHNLLEKAKHFSLVPVNWFDIGTMKIAFNPSVVMISGYNLSVLSIRTDRYNSRLRFSYTSFSHLTVKGSEKEKKEEYIDYGMLFSSPFIEFLSPPAIDHNDTTTFVATTSSMGWQENHEDARLFRSYLLDQESSFHSFYILFSFGRMIHGHEVFKQALSTGTIVAHSSYDIKSKAKTFKYYLDLQFPCVLQSSRDHDILMNEKNWMPFEYQNELHFIVSINPLIIEKISQNKYQYPYFNSSITNKPSSISSISRHSTNDLNQSQPRILTLDPVYHGQQYSMDSLPWYANDFGDSFKGSTNAIRIGHLYLAFFHTSPIIRHRRLYLFGLFSFCANPPFKLHAMSRTPLIHPAIYNHHHDQRPLNKYVWRVAFPMSLISDPDGYHVWVSVGIQDKHGMWIKFAIQQLLDSMEVIDTCPYW